MFSRGPIIEMIKKRYILQPIVSIVYVVLSKVTSNNNRLLQRLLCTTVVDETFNNISDNMNKSVLENDIDQV